MARVITFLDGTSKVLVLRPDMPDEFSIPRGYLEEIVREKLGQNTYDLLQEVLTDLDQTADVLREEMSGYEGTMESYADCMRSVREELSALYARMRQGRVPAGDIAQVLQTQIKQLDNEL